MEHEWVDSKDGKKVDGMGCMSVAVLVGPLATTKALQVVAAKALQKDIDWDAQKVGEMVGSLVCGLAAWRAELLDSKMVAKWAEKLDYVTEVSSVYSLVHLKVVWMVAMMVASMEALMVDEMDMHWVVY